MTTCSPNVIVSVKLLRFLPVKSYIVTLYVVDHGESLAVSSASDSPFFISKVPQPSLKKVLVRSESTLEPPPRMSVSPLSMLMMALYTQA